ncbi:PLC-like phosphodiesterase [Microthyrium microscopicum]|uniref:PLC-like phosphodiesterase n=1 Tax=Microthyrium microscopicum TaxID=703497 RepID=A0A6A6UCB5_9PEZI|nr:PLC-like phosphodiesterase [Microthyrium microscopicum]
MPTSKGIQCYSYICAPGCQVEFSIPGHTITKTNQKEYASDHLELDKKDLKGIFNFSGIFRFRVTQNGQELANKWVQINVLTGNLETGNMKAMEDQIAIVTKDIVITYTFYDAGNGEVGLPKWVQCMVSVSPNYSQWMTTVAAPGSSLASRPFVNFCLPSSHDIGMNSMQNSEVLLQNASTIFLSVLKMNFGVFSDISNDIVDKVLLGMAPNIIRGLAITQKDSLTNILQAGTRYFEFRPAHLYDVVRAANVMPDVLYFQHGPIPGMPYAQFLADCVSFLIKNPGEIVVFQIRWDGVPAQCARPDANELAKYLNDALAPSNGSLKAGSLDDMLNSTIDSLRSQNKRLIVLENVASYSTYDDTGNATLSGDSIIAEFTKLSPDNTRGHAFTNLQCQATATKIKNVVAYSSLTANVSNSCLLATKSICDNKTMPWVRDNALKSVDPAQLIVIMDDFVDGGMADLARDLSIKRLNGYVEVLLLDVYTAHLTACFS